MKYRLFGNSGLRVSEVSLGTMTFREDWGWGAPKDESRKIYDAYRKAGGNFIDTANLYTNGSSENLAGEFIHDHRQSVVLATKYTNPMAGDDPNAAGNHRKSMVQALEASLRRLKTDYIDLYWLHIWDQMTPVEEVMRAFDDLVRQGKILYIGVSDAPAWWIAQANTLAGMRGWTQFIGLQIEYSLIERTVERELIPMAKAFKLGLVAWSPLAGGAAEREVPFWRGRGGGCQIFDRNGQVFPAQRRAAGSGRSRAQESESGSGPPAQVALAWLRYRDISVIPIVGARRVSQLEDNLASLELELTREQASALDEASAIEMGFPHDFYENEMVKTVVYGGLRDKILAA
jgi:aryl-alcohol dehydrogenase-like predicted oxidoreductase